MIDQFGERHYYLQQKEIKHAKLEDYRWQLLQVVEQIDLLDMNGEFSDFSSS